jgi:hypothetical protein
MELKKNAVRTKTLYYRRLNTDRPDPIVFMSLAVNTSGRLLYDDVLRLIFLYDRRETSVLARELQEESDHLRCLRVPCFAHLEGSVGLILVKTSAMRISIPLELSTRPFIPLPRCLHSFSSTSPLLASALALFPPYSF